MGGLSVFPSLADGPEAEDEDEEDRRDQFCQRRPLVATELLGGSPGSEPEDSSLVRTLPSCFRWMWMWMGWASLPSAGV